MGKSVEPILATHACAHGFDVNFTAITCLMNKMLGLSCHRPTTLNRLFYFRLCDTCIVWMTIILAGFVFQLSMMRIPLLVLVS